MSPFIVPTTNVPPPVAEIRPFQESKELPAASGEEGIKLDAQLDVALRHLFDRLDSGAIPDDVEDADYRLVPLKRIGTVRVRYKRVRPLLPPRIEPEDDQ